MLSKGTETKEERKYDDESLVQSIMESSFWQGQTAEQLIDSLGNPHDVDKKFSKQRRRKFGNTTIKVVIGTGYVLL